MGFRVSGGMNQQGEIEGGREREGVDFIRNSKHKKLSQRNATKKTAVGKLEVGLSQCISRLQRFGGSLPAPL